MKAKKMIVIDYFDAHPEQLVFLGAGSGFVFIGNRAEFLRDKVYLEVDEIQMRRRSIAGATRDLNADRRVPMATTTRARLENRIDTYRNYCDEFIPYALREIVYVRQSLRDPNAVVIKMEGDEFGRYYTVAEYRGGADEWKPNHSAGVFECYVKLADAVVSDEGRRYANAISRPNTEETERTARICEDWFNSESIQIYSQLTGPEIIGSIRREVARRETRGIVLTERQRSFIQNSFDRHVPAFEMATRFNKRYFTDFTWYDLEYLVNRSRGTTKYIHFQP